jgi:hypothetical protein
LTTLSSISRSVSLSSPPPALEPTSIRITRNALRHCPATSPKQENIAQIDTGVGPSIISATHRKYLRCFDRHFFNQSQLRRTSIQPLLLKTIALSFSTQTRNRALSDNYIRPSSSNVHNYERRGVMLDAVLIFKDGAFISSYELLRQELSCLLRSRGKTFIHYARDVYNRTILRAALSVH